MGGYEREYPAKMPLVCLSELSMNYFGPVYLT